MPKNKDEKKETILENEEVTTENGTQENLDETEVENLSEENENSETESETEDGKDTSEQKLMEAGVKILELTKSLETASDQYLRLRAEFENYRKRTLSEADRAKIKGIGTAIEAFFPAMDGIDRALTMCKDEGIAKGILLVKKQFSTALTTLGVTEIDPKDEEFNPEFHNAVMNEVNPEKVGQIIEVFQKGYRYKDILLRPAMVKVGIEE